MLADAEEQEFERSVTAARARARERAAAAAAPQPVEEPEGILAWDERADVYRPRPVDARALAGGLDLAAPLDLAAGRIVVLVQDAALQRVRTHLGADRRLEHGGLLIGRALRDELLCTYVVMIDDAVPAREAIETAISVEYTPETWRSLLPVLRDLPDDTTIVGSYHSHPGLGVYLSETDMETQKAIFSQDWQVALVVDPVSGSIAFFTGEEGAECRDWRIVQ